MSDMFITIRATVSKILNDISEVQSSFIRFLYDACTQTNLQVKEVRDTYYYIFDDLERVYAKNQEIQLAINFYGIAIKLKDFTSYDDIEWSGIELQLKKKVTKSLLKGLGSTYEPVRQLLFTQFER